jgi:hypothetical protein
MSKNKHQHSLDFLQELFQEDKLVLKCPRTNCRGTMIKVLARYDDHGPLNNEFECTSCGKVRKDRFYADERRKKYDERRKQFKPQSGYRSR